MTRLFFSFIVFIVYSVTGLSQDDVKKQSQFLGILSLEEQYKTAVWTEREMTVIQAHFQRLVAEEKNGKIIFAGRTQYENDHKDLMGLVVFYAENMEKATEFMNSDPAVVGKIMKSQVHPYQIAVGNK